MMPGTGSEPLHETEGGRTAGARADRLVDWLKTPTGTAVGLFWLALLTAACVVIRMSIPLVAVEVTAMLFGLYASGLAFRKDRAAGYVILIATAFSFALLNWALYLSTEWTNPLAR